MSFTCGPSEGLLAVCPWCRESAVLELAEDTPVGIVAGSVAGSLEGIAWSASLTELAGSVEAFTVVTPGFAISVPLYPAPPPPPPVYVGPPVYAAPAYAPPPVYVGPAYLPPPAYPGPGYPPPYWAR